MKILGLIPARGQSKGVPRKNIRLLGKKPLIAYTIESALNASSLNQVIVSTEDEEIAQISIGLGVDVPFRRPAELAQDTTPMISVVQHAVLWMEQNNKFFDAVCLLQPTSPFRRSEHIDICSKILTESNADSVVSILPVPSEYNPHWVYQRNESGFLELSLAASTPITRRQDLPPAFHRDGSIYLVRRSVLLEKNDLYGNKIAGYLMDEQHSVNIDTVEDWIRAEKMLKYT